MKQLKKGILALYDKVCAAGRYCNKAMQLLTKHKKSEVKKDFTRGK